MIHGTINIYKKRTAYVYVLRYNAVLIGIYRYQHFGTDCLTLQSSLNCWATLNMGTARTFDTAKTVAARWKIIKH